MKKINYKSLFILFILFSSMVPIQGSPTQTEYVIELTYSSENGITDCVMYYDVLNSSMPVGWITKSRIYNSDTDEELYHYIEQVNLTTYRIWFKNDYVSGNNHVRIFIGGTEHLGTPDMVFNYYNESIILSGDTTYNNTLDIFSISEDYEISAKVALNDTGSKVVFITDTTTIIPDFSGQKNGNYLEVTSDKLNIKTIYDSEDQLSYYLIDTDIVYVNVPEISEDTKIYISEELGAEPNFGDVFGSDLVAFFPFYVSQVKDDVSPTRYTGTLYGNTYFDSSGAHFDGSGDYIKIPETIFYGMDELTVFFNTQSTQSTTGTILGNDGNYRVEFYQNIPDSHDTRGHVKQGSTIVKRYADEILIYDSNFHSEVWYMDLSTPSNTYLLYDGVSQSLTAADETITGTITNLDYDPAIGGQTVSSTTASSYFNGVIKELRIYKAGLSANELNNINSDDPTVTLISSSSSQVDYTLSSESTLLYYQMPLNVSTLGLSSTEDSLVISSGVSFITESSEDLNLMTDTEYDLEVILYENSVYWEVNNINVTADITGYGQLSLAGIQGSELTDVKIFKYESIKPELTNEISGYVSVSTTYFNEYTGDQITLDSLIITNEENDTVVYSLDNKTYLLNYSDVPTGNYILSISNDSYYTKTNELLIYNYYQEESYSLIPESSTAIQMTFGIIDDYGVLIENPIFIIKDTFGHIVHSRDLVTSQDSTIILRNEGIYSIYLYYDGELTNYGYITGSSDTYRFYTYSDGSIVFNNPEGFRYENNYAFGRIIMYPLSQILMSGYNTTFKVELTPTTPIYQINYTIFNDTNILYSEVIGNITSTDTVSLSTTKLIESNDVITTRFEVTVLENEDSVIIQKNYYIGQESGLWASLLLIKELVDDNSSTRGGKSFKILFSAIFALAVVLVVASYSPVPSNSLAWIAIIAFSLVAYPLGVDIGLIIILWLLAITATALKSYV